MKTFVPVVNELRFGNLIAHFGNARLVAGADGRVELCGGTDSDRTEAKEWISLFMHDAVPRLTAN